MRATIPGRRDFLTYGTNDSAREAWTGDWAAAQAGCGLLADLCARDLRTARPGAQADRGARRDLAERLSSDERGTSYRHCGAIRCRTGARGGPLSHRAHL